MPQLELLMDYTIFHIGLYTTLSAALVTLLGLFPKRASAMNGELLLTLIFFVLAGVCGGIVASHIPHFLNFDSFYESAWLGPWGLQLAPAWLWMRFEHLFFWSGIAAALFGLSKVVFGRGRGPQGAKW